MTARDLGILLIRLMALSIFINIIIGIPIILDWDVPQRMIGIIVSYCFSFIISIALWLFANKISNEILSGISPTDKFIQFSLPEIQAIAISLMGLYLLAHGIPDFFYQLSLYLRNENEGYVRRIYMDILKLVYPIGKIIFGFVLLLGCRGIVGFISKCRNAGLPKTDDIDSYEE